MGLDMNLYRRVRLDNNLELTGRRGKAVEDVVLNGQRDKNVGRATHYELTTAVCYWRKFNALHKYFADNFGGDEDNCVDMYLEIDDIRKLLMTLRDLRKQIKQDKDGNVINTDICKEMLPTQDGFFFGDTEYDKYYVMDIDDTIEMLSGVIEDHAKMVEADVNEYDISYFYRAWY